MGVTPLYIERKMHRPHCSPITFSSSVLRSESKYCAVVTSGVPEALMMNRANYETDHNCECREASGRYRDEECAVCEAQFSVL